MRLSARSFADGCAFWGQHVRRLAPYAATLSTLLAACRAAAQMDVDLRLGETVYILGEPIRADVRIVNRGTLPFIISSASPAFRQNGFFFDVLDREREPLVPVHPRTPLIPELLLPPGETKAAAFELDEWYPMYKTGRYLITAMAHREDHRYASGQRAIDIVPGLEMKSAIQLFADRPNEQRKLALVYWVRRQAEYLFLRVTDSPGDRVWTTLELGRLLRTTAPTIDVTPDGEIVIVHRATRDVFLRSRVRSSPAGVELLAQDSFMDPQFLQSQEAQRRLLEGKKKKATRHWWWPFGKSSDAST